MNGSVLQAIAVAAVPVIVAITLHEAAHAYAAWALGDDTAKRLGRLSLNPLRHVDPFGTIVLPAMLLLAHTGFLFGWAKPVPVAAGRFRDPRRGMALVAAAGPAANFFMAWLGALGEHGLLFMRSMPPIWLQEGLDTFIVANLVLGLFNLLPLPPLDGGRIAVGLLPLRQAMAWARLERVGLLLVLVLVFLGPRILAELGVRFDPVGDALEIVLPWAYHLVGRLAGLDG